MGTDWSYLRTYHTNIRHGDNQADCGDCNVGKCDVPELVDDWERQRDALRALVAACDRLATDPHYSIPDLVCGPALMHARQAI